ncbi:hypothetical protein BJ912DRAFT_175208 [Pholiota molesta]|nr:hypothetical protein BJ912DRAFT_175208 [Pholiota molesta]
MAGLLNKPPFNIQFLAHTSRPNWAVFGRNRNIPPPAVSDFYSDTKHTSPWTFGGPAQFRLRPMTVPSCVLMSVVLHLELTALARPVPSAPPWRLLSTPNDAVAPARAWHASHRCTPAAILAREGEMAITPRAARRHPSDSTLRGLFAAPRSLLRIRVAAPVCAHTGVFFARAYARWSICDLRRSAFALQVPARCISAC